MILRKNIQLCQNFCFDFAGDSCEKLGITKDVLVHFEKYANAFAFNNGSLLDSYRWL